jgi:hypothetical protein
MHRENQKLSTDFVRTPLDKQIFVRFWDGQTHRALGKQAVRMQMAWKFCLMVILHNMALDTHILHEAY